MTDNKAEKMNIWQETNARDYYFNWHQVSDKFRRGHAVGINKITKYRISLQNVTRFFKMLQTLKIGAIGRISLWFTIITGRKW